MEQIIEVRHISLKINSSFESFTRNLEGSLGKMDDSIFEGIETNPDRVRKRLEKAAGEEGLILIGIRPHGRLLNLVNAPKSAKHYIIGNPLVAVTMTGHDIRAGLYVPLRMLAYEAEDHSTRVEYDLPSSLLGQFGSPEITAVARTLDAKLANLIKNAETASQ